MKILLLSAYAAQSHRYWQQGLRDMLPDWDFTELNLPPRHFSWRIRGNALIWSEQHRVTLERDYDLLVATSMVDLATLRGLVPALSHLPSVLYFHENQFDYPAGRASHGLLEAQMVSLYAALAADRLVFNSYYNRDSFSAGLDALLRRLPDLVPRGVVQRLIDKSAILPVPLLAEDSVPTVPCWPGRAGEFPQRPLRLIWSARFEHDKGGEGLLRVLESLAERGVEFEIAVTGQQFRDAPAAFAAIERRFAPQLVQFGFVESRAQLQAMRSAADIVLSTALHEFQGLAVLQAVAAGCLPVVPDRLAYREIYPHACRYISDPDDPAREAAAAAELVQSLGLTLASRRRHPPSVEDYQLAALAPRYRALLQGLSRQSG